MLQLSRRHPLSLTSNSRYVWLVLSAGILIAGYFLSTLGSSQRGSDLSAPHTASRVPDRVVFNKSADISAAAGSVRRSDAPPVSRAGNQANLPSQIIRSDDISLRVVRKHLQHASDLATGTADRLGGYVVSTDRTGSREIYMVIRVPSSNFDRALSQLRGLGKVTSENVTGTDVTRQFVNLHARLANLVAQRKELLKLFAKSSSVQDTLRVQNVLSNVQYQIEQAEGTTRYLRNRVSLATVTLDLHTKLRHHHRRHTHLNPIFRAFGDAGNGVIKVIAGTIVAIGYAIPLAILALVGFALFSLIQAKAGARIKEPNPDAAA